MSIIFYSSYVPKDNEEYGLKITDKFLSFFNDSFEKDSYLYIGVQHGSSEKWISRLEQLSSTNDKIRYAIVDPDLYVNSDVSGFQAALKLYSENQHSYSGHVWFGHTKGVTTNNTWMNDVIYSLFWNKKKEIEAILDNDSYGSYGIWTTMLGKRYRNICSNFWRSMLSKDVNIKPAFNYFYLNTFYCIKNKVFDCFVKNVDKSFYTKLISGPFEPGNRWFFERDFVHISDVMGYRPYITELAPNVDWVVNNDEFEQNHKDWLIKKDFGNDEIWGISKSIYKIQQKKKEWYELMDVLKQKYAYGNILEIGCYDGGTTSSLCRFGKRLITIDLPEYPRYGKTGLDEFNQYCEHHYISGNSHNVETLDKVKAKLKGQKLDILFIDGDHSRNGVKQDLEMYYPLVQDNGIIIFHDIVDSAYHRQHGCTVSEFWNEIKGNYRSHEIYDNTECAEWGGLGIIIK